MGGIFLNSSRFNHACHPYATCTYSYNEKKKQLIIKTKSDIAERTELTISYGPAALMYGNYGFHCDCEGCPPPEVQAAEEQERRGDLDFRVSFI